VPGATFFADTARHDQLVALVDKMLVLTPKLRAATAESEKAVLQNAVTATDQQIDALVYELYGLNDDKKTGGGPRINFAVPESQRDSSHQPRVGERASLPWVARCYLSQPQRGCGLLHPPNRLNPVGVENILDGRPRVARASQPRAE
jgi:hypothetical protein